MGKNLIIRNSKIFELTEDGYELYETLKSIFGMLEKNFEFSEKNNIYQELSIGVRHSLSDFIFKNALTEFIDSIPNVHLYLSALESEKNKKLYII